jgi:hypothetical protein
MDEQKYTAEQLRQSIIDIAVETWRFKKIFERAMLKLDAGEGNRYLSQFTWFIKKVDAALKTAGLRIVSLEGQRYDIGMAVTPLNIKDFRKRDKLYIEQMIEPIIMDAQSVVKTGAVLLGKVVKQ